MDLTGPWETHADDWLRGKWSKLFRASLIFCGAVASCGSASFYLFSGLVGTAKFTEPLPTLCNSAAQGHNGIGLLASMKLVCALSRTQKRCRCEEDRRDAERHVDLPTLKVNEVVEVAHNFPAGARCDCGGLEASDQ